MSKIIVANWKCNPQTSRKAKDLFKKIQEKAIDIKGMELVICPPFIYLSCLRDLATNISLGAQDCFFRSGPFTGQISPQMLRNLDCKYVILGHSEKRSLGERDEMINKKLKAAIKANLRPILCIGEKIEQRKKGKTEKVLNGQLKNALNHLIIKSSSHLTIAYEPVWAIGTGKACSPKEAKKIKLFIKEKLVGFFSEDIGKNISLLYGGSVNSKIAKDYIEKSGMDGLLVGGASLDAKEFIEILKRVKG